MSEKETTRGRNPCQDTPPFHHSHATAVYDSWMIGPDDLVNPRSLPAFRASFFLDL